MLSALMVASMVGAGIAAGPAQAAIIPQVDAAGALAISQALTSTADITGASWTSVTGGTPNGTSDAPLAGFPTDGSTFGILTSGNVSSVPLPGTFADTSNGGGNVRGNSDLDVSILKTDFTAPVGANCLTFDFKFFSEEFPNFVGGSVNDAFIAEIDSSTWTTASSTITAPNNIAFDGEGQVVSINSTGVGGMTAAAGAGTAYDSTGSDTQGAATALLSASSQVTPGAHSIYFSLFDQGDTAYDSAVFLDNLKVGFVPNPEVNCVSGATPVTAVLDITPTSATNPVGTPQTFTTTLTNSTGTPIAGAPIAFSVTGTNPTTGTATTNASGVATFTYAGANAGTDQVAACYNADSVGPCEANASSTATWTGVAPVTHTLSVDVTGGLDGGGTVDSVPAGIDCPGEICSADFAEGSNVELRAFPAEGFVFSAWGGACEGAGECSVTMSGDQSVTATFSPVGETAELSVGTTGTGSVSSDPAGITCPTTCNASFAVGTVVTLTATPGPGFTFTGWNGSCEGTGSCVVTMNEDTGVGAVFEAAPAGNLVVTVVSEPPTVTAGSTVRQTYTVTNTGGAAQTNSTIVLNFPAGSTITSGTPGQGTCTIGPANTLTCELGTIPAGGDVVIPVLVTVPTGFTGAYSPTGTVSSDQSGTTAVEGLPGSDAVPPGGGQAFGFVPPGGTLSTGDATPEIPTAGSFTLPNTGPGAPISLTTDVAPPGFCGGLDCRGLALTLSPFEGYEDPRRPAVLDISLDASLVAQFGPSYGVWVQKEDQSVAPWQVQDCKKEIKWGKYKHWHKVKWFKHHGHWHYKWWWHWKYYVKSVKKIADPSPCVAKRYIDENGDSHVRILILSGDPKFARR